MKKELQDGTKDEQRIDADNSTSASVEANPMLPTVFEEWFKSLWRGTTDFGRQELIDFTDTHSLIRMKHKGAWSGWESCVKGGYTEWVVAINGEYTNNSYKEPVAAWKKEGRLLKAEKQEIFKNYGLSANGW